MYGVKFPTLDDKIKVCRCGSNSKQKNRKTWSGKKYI